MNARQVIDKLNDIPGDTPIVITTATNDYMEIEDIELTHGLPTVFNGIWRYVEESDDHERAQTLASIIDNYDI